MKDHFLRLQISDECLNPFNCKFVANCHGYFSITLDLFVEFHALIAHRTPFELRTGATLIGRLIFKTIGRENCSLEDLERFNYPVADCAPPIWQAPLTLVRTVSQPEGAHTGSVWMVQPRPVSLSLLHLGGFVFGLCRARRPVDGVAFVPAFFGTSVATARMKREAHRCSKRLEREEE
jgi:hypothetical protein